MVEECNGHCGKCKEDCISAKVNERIIEQIHKDNQGCTCGVDTICNHCLREIDNRKHKQHTLITRTDVQEISNELEFERKLHEVKK